MSPPTPSPTHCSNPSCRSSSPGQYQKFLRCSRCRTTHYCSPPCQSHHWPLHKLSCHRPNYLLKFTLLPQHITSPPITRTLSCPSSSPFSLLHSALQIAFGYADIHAYDFAIKDPLYRDPETQQEAMLLVVQRCMTGREVGTLNPNLPDSARQYLLRLVDGKKYSPEAGRIDKMHEGHRRHPKTTEKRAAKTKLWQVWDEEEWKDKEIVYVYDFGNNWEHKITLVGRAPAKNHFECVGGEGHPVAEGVSSYAGWEKLKQAYRAANPTEEQREKMRWYGNVCANGDREGLRGDRVNVWDREEVNEELLVLSIGN